MWSNRNPALLLGMQISTTTVVLVFESPQKLEIELPYDPVIPLLAIYPNGCEIITIICLT
jgi:hypothetical protein